MPNQLPNLMTQADMATRWGVTVKDIYNWSKRHANFPAPVMRLSNGQIPVYLESDVAKYESERKPRTRTYNPDLQPRCSACGKFYSPHEPHECKEKEGETT